MLCCIWLEPVESRTRCRNENLQGQRKSNPPAPQAGPRRTELVPTSLRARVAPLRKSSPGSIGCVARVMPTDDSVTTFLTVELFGPEISGSRVALDCRFGALLASGASVHFLQKLAHCIELRAEAFPISGLQSLHCLIVAIKRLPCLTCRRACGGPLLCRG